VVQRAELGRGHRVIGAALDGQHEGVDLAVGKLAQPGADVPAHRDDLQVAAGGAEQGGAAGDPVPIRGHDAHEIRDLPG
jgi:hypothetical protein